MLWELHHGHCRPSWSASCSKWLVQGLNVYRDGNERDVEEKI